MPAASLELKTFAPADRPAPSRLKALVAGALRSFHDARLRHAEREIARFIEGRGGRMTDDMERRIERHLT